MSLAEEMAEAMGLETAARGAGTSAAEPGLEDDDDLAAGDGSGALPGSVDGQEVAGKVDLHYDRLADWVHEWLYPQLAADRTRRRPWCSQWYSHPEAVGVLGALWHQWEVSRLEPMVGMSTYYVHYYLPLIGYLTQPSGTFGACAKATSDAGDVPVHKDSASGCSPPAVVEPDGDTAAALAASVWMPLTATDPTPGAAWGTHG